MTMKKLLFHFDTDPIASVFDAVVAYDSGIDHLIQLSGINSDNCGPLVEGAIFTRPVKAKKNTAIFIGGSDLVTGQSLFDKVKTQFFDNFRVSVMLDSNGCNTTAAAGVALIAKHYNIKDKIAVVLAGTGPVGQRAAVMLALEGAEVHLTSRTLKRATQVCETIQQRFGIQVHPVEAKDNDSTNEILASAQLVFAAGKGGVQLLNTEQWQKHPNLEVLADVNTQPPLGFEGIQMTDMATDYGGKLIFGGLGIGALKLKLHKLCIAELFNSPDQLLDAEKILSLSKNCT